MKKLVLLVLTIFFLTSCSPYQIGKLWSLSKYYFIDLNGQRVYMEGSADATYFASDGAGFMEYDNCRVNFAKFDRSILVNDDYKEGLQSQARNFSEQEYEAVFNDNKLVIYIGHEEVYDLVFWLNDPINGVERCIDYLEFYLDSLRTDQVYVNEDFGITFELPHNYMFEDFENGQGLRLIKRFPGVNEGEKVEVEIVVYAFKNHRKVKSVEEYVELEFPEYDLESVDYWGQDSGYITLNRKVDLVRQYYAMGFDKSYIYGAYLKAPSDYFYSFLNEFEMFIREVTFFK